MVAEHRADGIKQECATDNAGGRCSGSAEERAALRCCRRWGGGRKSVATIPARIRLGGRHRTRAWHRCGCRAACERLSHAVEKSAPYGRIDVFARELADPRIRTLERFVLHQHRL